LKRKIGAGLTKFFNFL